jgi:hypothetical protein
MPHCLFLMWIRPCFAVEDNGDLLEAVTTCFGVVKVSGKSEDDDDDDKRDVVPMINLATIQTQVALVVLGPCTHFQPTVPKAIGFTKALNKTATVIESHICERSADVFEKSISSLDTYNCHATRT